MLLSKSKIALYLLGTFLGVFGLLVLGTVMIAKHHLANVEKTVLDAGPQEASLESVWRDLVLLDAVPALAQAARLESEMDPARDAGAFLNGSLPWQHGQDGVNSKLALPFGVRAVVDAWGSTWPVYLDRAPLEGVDFGWMADLKTKSYWQLEEPQDRDLVAASDPMFAKDVDPAYEALPDLGLLSVWIKLRLASIRQGAPAAPALGEIQHLAGLALTTQRMSVIQAGLIWFELAREAEDYAAKEGVPITLTADFLTREEIKRAHKALPAQMAYLDLAVPASLAERMFPVGTQRLGICAALRQRLPALHWEETLLGSDFPASFTALRTLIQRMASGCRPSPAFIAWASKDRAPPLLLAKDGLLNRWFMRVPYLRRAFALTLYDLVRPKDLEPYLVDRPREEPR